MNAAKHADNKPDDPDFVLEPGWTVVSNMTSRKSCTASGPAHQTLL
jgi:hypothetical protein